MSGDRGRWINRLTLEDGSTMDVYEADLIGPKGKRGFPNAVFYAAREAMAHAIQHRLDCNEANRGVRPPSQDEPFAAQQMP